MKTYYNILLLVLILALSLNIKAQNLTNYNLYTSNNLLYNPAGFIPSEKLVGFANYHSQWLNLSGAPSTQSVGLAYHKFSNMGFGVSLSNYTAGMLNTLTVLAGYGYKINFNDSSNFLNMGVALGVTNDVLKTSMAENIDINDIVLNNNYYNKTLFSSGFGIIYHYQNIETGIALPKLYDHNRLFNQTSGLLTYRYKFKDDFILMPSVFYNYVRDFQNILDFNLMTKWKENLWLQLGYRTNNSLLISLGTKFYRYEIAYAYEYNNSKLANVNYGSHELQLLYKVGNEKRIKSIDVEFYITDKTTNKPVITNIKIEESNIPYQSISSNENGFAKVKLKQGKTYNVNIENENHYALNDVFAVSIDSIKITKEYQLVPKTVLVTGTVKDIKNKVGLSKAEIKLMDGNKILNNITANNNGSFDFVIDRYKDYTLIIESKNHKTQKIEFNTRLDADKKVLNVELEPFVKISGQILEFDTNKPISLAEIKITDLNTNKIYKTTSDKKGIYNIEINDISETKLQIDITKQGYLYAVDNVDINSPFEDVKMDFKLEKITEGVKVVLENVVFDEGKSELKESSLEEINKIIEIMKTNPDINIELSGHTDNSGSYETNKKISKDRAQAVANYMISKGIDEKRLVVVGYGPDKPRDTNNTAEGRERNRRVEAKVIK
ncbi:MAG: hypothetical protein Kow0068_03970 [Marinilabiliales bacterium]